MKRGVVIIPIAFLAISFVVQGHDIITTAVTWDREISRIFYSRCASCHHEGGMAFSLMTYAEAFPWKTAIKEEVLERRMPPWGGVKGFGDFRNDQALTPEQLELITSWAQGGAPDGDPQDLPPAPKMEDLDKSDTWLDHPSHFEHRSGEIAVMDDLTLDRDFTLDGLWPKTVPENAAFQIMAEFPDGRVEPLLWLSNYKAQFAHPFLLREPLDLPAGTAIRGVPPEATVVLLPAEPSSSNGESQNAR
jgi:hypothetical protein